jgi:hypothetical protein
MMGSSPIERMNAIGCSSDAGAYYLSKTYFEIEIEQWGLVPPAVEGKPAPKPVSVWYEVKQVVPKRKPDREYGYCLDYLSSPTADEKVWVRKSADYLLTLISTQSIDQSAYIAKAIIGTLFRGITVGESRALVNLTRKNLGIAFKGEYDPLDRAQSAIINTALKDLGFCLVLENETFDARTLSINSYCDDPRRALAGHLEKARPPKLAAHDTSFKGIAYRPRVPYNYYLFVREAQKGQATWKLRQSESITIESKMTVINVGVDRSFFANRRTSLIFDQGALRNVCIYKSSELAELATIPLAIAKNVAALPSNVIQLRIDNTNNYQKLASAEDELIRAQQAHLNLLSGSGNGASAPSGAPDKVKDPAFTFDPVGKPKTENEAFSAEFNRDWQTICPQDPHAANFANIDNPAAIGTGSVLFTAQPIGPTP